VECEDKACVWQDSPSQAQQIDAEIQEMVKMDDIGPNGLKKFAVGVNQTD
jgi:hypothetical protein